MLTVLHHFCHLLLSDDFAGWNLLGGAFLRCGFLSAFAWGETGNSIIGIHSKKAARFLLNHSLSPGDFQCHSSASNPTDKGGGGRRPVKEPARREKNHRKAWSSSKFCISEVLKWWAALVAENSLRQNKTFTVKLHESILILWISMNQYSMLMSVDHLPILFCIPYYPRRNQMCPKWFLDFELFKTALSNTTGSHGKREARCQSGKQMLPTNPWPCSRMCHNLRFRKVVSFELLGGTDL